MFFRISNMTIMTIITIIKTIFSARGKSIIRSFIQGIACACIIEVIHHIPASEQIRILFRRFFPLIYCICIFLVLIVPIKRQAAFPKHFSLGWQSLGLMTAGAVFSLAEKIAGVSFISPSSFIFVGILLLVFNFCFQFCRR